MVDIGMGKAVDVTPLIHPGLYHSIIILLIACCILYSACSEEGFRNLQLPFLLGYFMLSCAMLADIDSTLVLGVQSLVIGLIVLYNFTYGEVSFFQFKTNGRWEVGHKDIHTKRSGLAVSVYYPISKAEHKRLLAEGKESHWLRYGRQSLKGLVGAMASVDPGRASRAGMCYFTYLLNVRMGTAQDADLATEFAGRPVSLGDDE